MSKILTGSINLSKIDKTALYKSDANGNIYLNVVVFLHDEEDQYENIAAIAQSYPKESRPDKTLYLGNLKELKQSKPEPIADDDPDLDHLPF